MLEWEEGGWEGRRGELWGVEVREDSDNGVEYRIPGLV